MGYADTALPESIFLEQIMFRDVYQKNENAYLIVAKDAEKYMAMLSSLINGKQDIIPMSDENKQQY